MLIKMGQCENIVCDKYYTCKKYRELSWFIILVLFMAKIISFAKYLYKGGNTDIYPVQECLF